MPWFEAHVRSRLTMTRRYARGEAFGLGEAIIMWPDMWLVLFIELLFM